MGREFDPLGPWERVASELRACRESQQRAWGDLDSALIGRYLAGDVTHEERNRVDVALEQLPQLRELTDLVRDVLTTSEPEAAPPADPGPTVLRLPPRPAPRRAWVAVLRRRASIAAAACLLVTLGLAMPRTGALPAPGGADARLAGGVASRDVAFAGLEGTQPAGAFDIGAARVAEAVAPWTEEAKLARLEVDRSIAELKRGDLVRAERTLRQAHALCKRKWGENHPTTYWTQRHLAGVYQVALNTPAPPEVHPAALSADDKSPAASFRPFPAPAPGPPAATSHAARSSAPPAPPPPRGERFAAPARQVRETALALRVRLTRDEPARVQASVVPVLVAALREAKGSRERAGLAQALANLGPSARDAVPALVECLKKSDNERERQALRLALWRLKHAPPKSNPARGR